MHELSLAEAINNTIKNLCDRSSWERVRRIVLKIGRMRQVDSELLSFAFSVVAGGTVCEGAELSILELPIIFRCRACGKESSSEGTSFLGPLCASADVELRSGMELTIESMEVEGRQAP
jgi:hydrogenase nickel incorporation protein HypA/HybF